MDNVKVFDSMDCLKKLRKLGVPASCLENFDQSFSEGPKNIRFTSIISWLSKQLQALCDLECCITPITDPDDSASFMVEVSSFIKETMCPYCCLTEGSMSQRLAYEENKANLLGFMISELLAARMICSEKSPKPKGMILKMQESLTAKMLKEMAIALKLVRPPDNITPVQFFTRVEAKIKDLINTHPKLEIGEPLFTGALTNKQWFTVEKLQEQMFEEFKSRRNMLLMRLDVTIKSFSWSDRLKNTDDKIAQIYDVYRKQLCVSPIVVLADLLAARKELIIIEKTSSASVREKTKSSVNKVVIGAVPDRGGRPEEQQPPPPEVPSWQKSEPPKSNYSASSGGQREKHSFNNYSDQNSPSYFSNQQSHNIPQSTNSHGYQGYSAPRTEYESQSFVYRDGFDSQKNYGYMSHGAGNAFQNAGVDFNRGFGGYGATGGNFQQYGGGLTTVQPIDSQQMNRNTRGGYNRRARGGRGGWARGGGNYRQ